MVLQLSVVVYDLHVVYVSLTPSEADPPLIIDADAALTGAVAGQFLQPVARRYSQIDNLFRRVQYQQFAECGALQCGRPPRDRFASKQALGVSAGKTANHRAMITLSVINVKRYYSFG